ncbi:MAG: hypothetical protein MUO24_06180 [Desulfobacterales bacterium]|nr:hypothetical protein [Desulfobacterales bacterium]
MKGYRRIVIVTVMVTVFLTVMGCAGKSGYMVTATPVAGPASDKALVYFMRPSGMGFAVHFQIWDSDHFVGLSQAKSYAVYECAPGTHLFIGIAENKVALKADLGAGKSYYVGTNVRTGWAKARMQFTPVTRGSELWDKVEGYKPSLNCISAKEEERAKWEAAKKQEVLKLIEYFTNGAGNASVLKLSKEDGR